MKFITAVVLALAFAVPASAQPVGVAPYTALVIGNSLDLLTTVQALQGGAHEANPLMGRQPSTPQLVAVKGASALTVGLLMRTLGKRGHPTAAKVLGYATGIGLTFVATHNANVGRRQ
jgi:hypothetical protein